MRDACDMRAHLSSRSAEPVSNSEGAERRRRSELSIAAASLEGEASDAARSMIGRVAVEHGKPCTVITSRDRRGEDDRAAGSSTP
jgi:hypothetical protein